MQALLGREQRPFMQSQIYRLIYVSRCNLPVDPDGYTAGVMDILRWSRPWNARTDVTGVLMCSPGRFAQVLEGPAPAIKATFGHIACDTRIKEPKLLSFEDAARREFPNWAMAYVDEGGLSEVSLVGFRNAIRSEDGRAIVSILRWLVDQPLAKARA